MLKVKDELDNASGKDNSSVVELKVRGDESLTLEANAGTSGENNSSAELKVKSDKSVLKEEVIAETSGKDKCSWELNIVKSDESLNREEVTVKTESSEHRETIMIKQVVVEPPTFISDSKSYAEYKKDLLVWSRICGIEKKLQAETVVYRFENHSSRIKEKVNTQIGDKLVNR